MAVSSPSWGTWVSMTLAGLVLGGTLALQGSLLFDATFHSVPGALRAQLDMWVVMPVWFTALSGVYAFRTGRRAWLGLGALNAVALVLVALTHLL